MSDYYAMTDLKKEKEIVAILENIRSVHNVGSIFRTADGAGIAKLYLCGITPQPIDRFGNVRYDFSKVALGAEKSVPWAHARSALGLVKVLKNNGYAIYAIEQDKRSMPYSSLKTAESDKIALIIGSETEGISKALLERADKILEIPMRGTKESLNVSVAFGVAAYRLTGK